MNEHLSLTNRPRRLRKNPIIREMVTETHLSKEMFVFPYFVTAGKNNIENIASMPGINRFSSDVLIKEVEKGLKMGINKVLLFGVGEEKSEDGTTACNHNSIVANGVRLLKSAFGEDIYIITDVCLCAYTTHGHCGILKNEYVQNDHTAEVLANMALTHAISGTDMVAPSDMMDGRVKAIRSVLDKNGYTNTAIMSYAVKFASAYYGPFREAADSSPGKGDRKSYQMDFRNGREALKEAIIDEAESADVLMVKPALAYLDIIKSLRECTLLPVACYNVSAEYSMVKSVTKEGLIDERSIVMENMYAFARAGAGIIITYHARDILEKNWI